jgi:hypothetical protein
MSIRPSKRERAGFLDATTSQLESLHLWMFARARQAFSPALQCLFFLCLVGTAFAGVGGSISGTVKDPSGAAIVAASVVLANVHTGVEQSASTDARGAYTFPVLPVGDYVLAVSHTGFRPYRRTGIVLDANSSLLMDVVLQIGERTDAVTVSESAVHLETYSSQVGEVINGEQMSTMPLDGRSFTDLLSLQPGVVPSTSINSETVQDVGASALSPSGDLNPGTISIHGQREFANAFIVNGSDSEEDVNMGTAIIPNLDSSSAFSPAILTRSTENSAAGRSTSSPSPAATRFTVICSSSCAIRIWTRAIISRPIAEHLFRTSSVGPSADR